MSFPTPDPSSIQGTGVTIVGTILSYLFGWIDISTITDAVVIGIISLLIGYYGPKLLNWIHNKDNKKKKSK